ncbi:hypothetical protein HK405_011474 [Cladochytrium tenue]|nr:hypothetical protein HK405_011474 [Cladochytrium tenue]
MTRQQQRRPSAAPSGTLARTSAGRVAKKRHALAPSDHHPHRHRQVSVPHRALLQQLPQKQPVPATAAATAATAAAATSSQSSSSSGAGHRVRQDLAVAALDAELAAVLAAPAAVVAAPAESSSLLSAVLGRLRPRAPPPSLQSAGLSSVGAHVLGADANAGTSSSSSSSRRRDERLRTQEDLDEAIGLLQGI